jgi:hypothetical protein
VQQIKDIEFQKITPPRVDVSNPICIECLHQQQWGSSLLTSYLYKKDSVVDKTAFPILNVCLTLTTSVGILLMPKGDNGWDVGLLHT